MSWKTPALLGALPLAVLALPEPARTAPGPQQAGAERFYKAYWQEREQQDWELAAKLYEQVAADDTAPVELRKRAARHLARCREELVSADFAHLMPPSPWAYFEMSRPGDHLIRLLDRLGLMREGALEVGEGQRSVQISPELIRGLLGVRGMAMAITGFNPVNQTPNGVLVLHPGDLAVARGLIESVLPAAVPAAEPLEGYPTWRIENQVWVTMTERLIVVSPNKVEVRKVLKRLSGSEKSLADDTSLIAALGNRDDALLTFCVNPKPMVPLLNLALMGASESDKQEIQMARTMLDPEHLHSLTGHVMVHDDGLSMDLALRLDEGHRNLVFNLMRTPRIERSTLERIPAGAAGFMAWSFNELQPGRTVSAEPEVVTGLDVGRELFGNLVSLAVFALPGEGVSGPIPDVAAVMTVNDPAKSQALWSLMLGLGSMAAGGGAMEGEGLDMGGVHVQTWRFPDGGPTIHAATSGNELVLATSATALAGALEAPAAGQSVYADPGFGRVLANVGDGVNQICVVHPGRLFQMAQPHMSANDLAEAEPFIELLDALVVGGSLSHGPNMLRMEALVSGLPRVDTLVAERLSTFAEHGWPQHAAVASAPAPSAPVAVRARGADHSLQELFELNASKGEERSRAIAAELGQRLVQQDFGDAKALNGFAWKLLTEDPYQGHFTELAHTAAVQANELTGFANWMYLDTLAHAEFARGDAGVAVELERQALEIVEPERAAEVEAALERFQAAQHAERPTASAAGALR